MLALKTQLLDNKMDDESISDKMLAITVSGAKQWIKEKKFIINIYNALNIGSHTKINKQ
jgi:hypothetical protein